MQSYYDHGMAPLHLALRTRLRPKSPLQRSNVRQTGKRLW